jgi:mortality factor 4-like protein 1
MAPSKAAAAATPPFARDEKVLCFHHEMLYEAKILDVRPADEPHAWQYKIHYKGWKKTWDDWVPQDRVRKFTEENKELATQLHNQMKQLQNGGKGAQKKGGARTNGSDFSSARGSEERHASVAAQSGRGPRRNRDYDLESEETFLNRPSINLIIPDHIKAKLVDDWENVTKNQLLVPLPAAYPVNTILQDYLEFELPKKQPGSSQAQILEEFVSGLKEYFEKCLGRILLYKYERGQYSEMHDAWNASTGELAGKTAGDTYGAEHLCRLLVSLPELVAQTNMDTQSINRLREELTKLTNWLGKSGRKYWVSAYELPNQEYIDKARNA